jgi:hypothetical protein
MKAASLIIAGTIVATLAATTTSIVRGQGREAHDPREALLAALGTATLDCLGTVGPTTYRTTTTGVLERAFDACRRGGAQALAQIDALLGVQLSREGAADGIASFYVATWNAFIDSFPHDTLGECPVWRRTQVIDPPSFDRVVRFFGRVGKENYHYAVSSRECGASGACAVRNAVTCAGGFGSQFVLDVRPRAATVVVDPAWWLTTYDFSSEPLNPFKMPGYYHAMSYYGNPPGALYGAIQRAGEACSQWDVTAGKHYTDRVLVPIDCGGGWFCMAYCTIPPPSGSVGSDVPR